LEKYVIGGGNGDMGATLNEGLNFGRTLCSGRDERDFVKRPCRCV